MARGLVPAWTELLYPHSVYITRGNHEDYLMNKRYGFEQEVSLLGAFAGRRRGRGRAVCVCACVYACDGAGVDALRTALLKGLPLSDPVVLPAWRGGTHLSPRNNKPSALPNTKKVWTRACLVCLSVSVSVSVSVLVRSCTQCPETARPSLTDPRFLPAVFSRVALHSPFF